MTPPKRGQTFEEAAERWADETIRERFEAAQKGLGEGPIKIDLAKCYAILDRYLLARLYAMDLCASGFEADSRVLRMINPEEVHPNNATYDRRQRVIRIKPRMRAISQVEVFEIGAVPINLPRIEYWYEKLEAREQPISTPVSEPPADRVFTPSADYRHVMLDGREYALTRKQAAIVRVLHAAIAEHPPVGWLHLEKIRNAVGFESDKLSHLFRRDREAWNDLIRSDKRGHYRLNL